MEFDRSGMVLGHDDPPPFVVRRGGRADFVLACDHASVAIPKSLGTLGLGAGDLATHIAIDIGARWVAERVAELLDATLICASYSRLVVDCNRYPWNPGSIAAQSAGVTVPGNRDLSDADRRARLAAIFIPYQRAISATLDELLAAGEQPVFVSIHSCTPVLDGPARPWPIGIGYADEAPYSRCVIEALERMGVDPVGDNEPYAMEPGADYTTPEQALRRALEYVQVEFRQDLVATEAQAHRWAMQFADALLAAAATSRPSPAPWVPPWPPPHAEAADAIGLRLP